MVPGRLARAVGGPVASSLPRHPAWTQHDTIVHDLAVPGDTSTGTEKVSGLQARAWVPGGGTILTDAGQVLVDVSTDEVAHISAHHPYDDYFRLGDTSAPAALCAALA